MKIFNIFFILFICLLFPFINPASQKEAEPQNEIDKALEECLSIGENQTTRGMINCFMKASDAYKEKIERLYEKLSNILNEEEKELLKKSKDRWKEYRDAEFALLELIYLNKQGTMWNMILADQKLQLNKRRAMLLQNIYDDYVFE